MSFDDRPVEVANNTGQPGETAPLVDMSDPAVARIADRRLADPYGYSGSPEDDPTKKALEDPYAHHGSPEVTLSADVEKKIKEDLAAYQKSLVDGNFSFGFKATEGPWNAITRLRTEATAKQKAGKELSAEEKAVLSIPDSEMVSESRRIRDRDFKTFAENGDPRNWYTTKDKTQRYTEKDMAEMAVAKEKQLRDAAVKAETERLAAAEKAEKDRLAAEQAEKDRLAAEQAEKDRLAAEQAEKDRVALQAAVEAHVPPEAIVKQALTQSEIGGDAAAVRTNMKGFVAAEVQAGTLKRENLAQFPSRESAYIATGAVTPAELTAARAEQARLHSLTPQQPAPEIAAVLEATFKDDPAKLDKIKKAGRFHEHLKRLTDEAKQPKR